MTAPVVLLRPNALQQLIEERLHALGDERGPLSIRQAALRADGLISYEHLRTLARGGNAGNMTDRVAEALSRALSVPVERVYEAAHVPAPRGPWVLPERLHRLGPRERKLVEDFAFLLLDNLRPE